MHSFDTFKYPEIPQGRPAYPTARNILHLEAFIDVCKWHSCIPIVQINAGVALRYGIDACVSMVWGIIDTFDWKGLP